MAVSGFETLALDILHQRKTIKWHHIEVLTQMSLTRPIGRPKGPNRRRFLWNLATQIIMTPNYWSKMSAWQSSGVIYTFKNFGPGF